MIFLDIETSGLLPSRNGIWQIGALDINNPSNTFLEEAKIDITDEASEKSLRYLNKTEDYIRDEKKQTQFDLMRNFFSWVNSDQKIKSVVCQNPKLDLSFIEFKAEKYMLSNPLHYRSFDLHSTAQMIYNKVNGCFLMETNSDMKGIHSGMGLTNVLEFCGMKDNRGAHNALEDAKLGAECFSRLVYGKNLLTEYSQYKIPGVLKQ